MNCGRTYASKAILPLLEAYDTEMADMGARYRSKSLASLRCSKPFQGLQGAPTTMEPVALAHR